ncbi:MAG: tripartite tricarboxylate transporter TctB family protein [Burkholderiales bacterium]
MIRVDARDLVGGVVLVGIGLFTAVFASSHYALGQLARMGPGFFPTALGCVLVGLGTLVVLLSFRQTTHTLHPPPFRPRALVAVLAAVLVFSLTVTRFGLVPATLVLVFVSALAEPGYRWKRTALLALALAAMSWLIFIVGLQMTLPAFTFPG